MTELTCQFCGEPCTIETGFTASFHKDGSVVRHWDCPKQAEPPVRICCGKRHGGVQCPDGKVMCCLCFERFLVTELATEEDGIPTNVCKPCQRIEEVGMLFYVLAGNRRL